ncbi:transcriptional repressor NrdR [bacterium]|nr:transcriptional repressor NrdR [bacterium]
MKCPYCGFDGDKVVDSRSVKDGRAVRRRRECSQCEKRYTTYEYIQDFDLIVIKVDGRREPYERQKLLQGITIACRKRPVSAKKIEAIVDEVENQLMNLSRGEIESKYIGGLVMEALRGIDEVAYVRFASVYKKFKDVNEFWNMLKELLGKEEPENLK